MGEIPKESQGYIKQSERMVYARLYDIFGWQTWWLLEYDPKTKNAYGFTKTKYWLKGWVTENIFELEVFKGAWRSLIELDEFFKPTKFKNLPWYKKGTLD